MLMRIIKCHSGAEAWGIVPISQDQVSTIFVFMEQLGKQLCSSSKAFSLDRVMFVVLDQISMRAELHPFTRTGGAELTGSAIRCAGRWLCEQLGRSETKIAARGYEWLVSERFGFFSGLRVYEVMYPWESVDVVSTPRGVSVGAYESTHTVRVGAWLVFLSESNGPMKAVELKEDRSLSESGRFGSTMWVNCKTRKVDSVEYVCCSSSMDLGHSNSDACVAIMRAHYPETDRTMRFWNGCDLLWAEWHSNESSQKVPCVLGNVTFIYDAEVLVQDGVILGQGFAGSFFADEVLAYADGMKRAQAEHL